MDEAEPVEEEGSGIKKEWLVRYSEVFLKSDWVRRGWEKRIVDTIRRRMPAVRARIERGRIWLEGDVDPEILRRIFGVASFSEVEHVQLGELEAWLLDYCRRHDLGSAGSFALKIKRVGEHPFTSAELAAKYGDLIRREFGDIPVNLKSPEKTIHIEIRGSDVYIYDHVTKGAGGLPSGVEGTVVALLSGGIDSVVAAWLMMKRGCLVAPLYISIAPFLNEDHLSRAEELVNSLKAYQPDIELHVIEDRYLQLARERLVRRHLERYTCILCKRRMYRLACDFAVNIGAKGIVTGESLGQVASQTLENLLVLDEAAALPVYRPLIGFDKEEIIGIAREIGTYRISTSGSTECTAAPKKASTAAKLEKIREIEVSIEEEIGDLTEEVR
ncbi:MAG: tRNA uracil 4-sulfurtransferase ThiI [Methanomicrobiales archaeon]|nr:tRNA uracil 4-sulfurtransferase ThiI [Methanomicrobiales archaeon]